jgi:hypothetical protein
VGPRRRHAPAGLRSGRQRPGSELGSGDGRLEQAYADGVAEAQTRGAFKKGVSKSGNAKWAAKTKELGVGRWAPGIRASETDYTTAMQPVVQTIERTVLPPRGPRGDPRNMERAVVMARALADARKRA